jgi:uncharacterized protein
MKRRIAGAALIAAALIGCRGENYEPVREPAAARSTISGLELVPLTIRSGTRAHEFTVEVARTNDQQAQGLMFRERLGPDEGMLFPRAYPQPMSFWMKNTLIPLDMIFVREDGTIARIAANTVPHSLDAVESGEPVVAVLEIAGGRSAELGIQTGDRVTWPGGPQL